MPRSPFSVSVVPDWEGLVRCIRRAGTPPRVHAIELFLDPEVKEAVCGRFDLLDGMDQADPTFDLRREIAIQRFLGYDYVRCSLEGMEMPLKESAIADTASATWWRQSPTSL